MTRWTALEQAHDLWPQPVRRLDDKIQEAAAEVFACSYCSSARGDEAAEEQSGPPAKETLARKLSRPVTLNFNEAPLSQVIDSIRATQGVNIYVDKAALDADEISLDTPITIKLEMVSLKSVLHLILKSARLSFVVKDESIQITTERVAPPYVTYPVGELIIPVQVGDAPSLRTCLPPVDPQVPAVLDGLYPETSDPVQLAPASDEEQEPPADVLKGAAKPFVQATDLEKVGGIAKDGGAADIVRGRAKGDSPPSCRPNTANMFIGLDGLACVFPRMSVTAAPSGTCSTKAAPCRCGRRRTAGPTPGAPPRNPPDDASGD